MISKTGMRIIEQGFIIGITDIHTVGEDGKVRVQQEEMMDPRKLLTSPPEALVGRQIGICQGTFRCHREAQRETDERIHGKPLPLPIQHLSISITKGLMVGPGPLIAGLKVGKKCWKHRGKK